MEDYITVMVKNPGRPWHESRVRKELSKSQTLVGGYIETVPVDEGMMLMVNEEGKLRGMAANFEYRQDILCGPVVAVGILDDRFSSCPIRTDEGMRFMLGDK